MSYFAIWPIHENLKGRLNYVLNPNETRKSNSRYMHVKEDFYLSDPLMESDRHLPSRESFCTGIYCNTTNPWDQFSAIKKQFGKTGGIQGFHAYLSFRETNIQPELAFKIGTEFAEKIWGGRFQVILSTHLQAPHVHCHFVVNSVSYLNGKKPKKEDVSFVVLRKRASEICENHHLSPISAGKSRVLYYLEQKEQNGFPSHFNVTREALQEAAAASTNMSQLKQLLQKMGYTLYRFDDSCEAAMSLAGSMNPVRLSKLGPSFSVETLQKQVSRNRCCGDFVPPSLPLQRALQYRLPTRLDALSSRPGLLGTYQQYRCRLGVLPNYARQKSYCIHPLLRDGLMHLEDTQKQAAFLSAAQISRPSQLIRYRQMLKDKITVLDRQRHPLYKKKSNPSLSKKQQEACQRELSAYTKAITGLRQDYRLCISILQQYETLEHTLTAIRHEEQTKIRREKNQYEHKQ